MILSPALCETLVSIGKAMAGAQDAWWLIGSAAAALHGARGITPADVDVLLSPADARRLLPPLGVALAPGRPDARFRSELFGRWTEPPLPVEFMAGFQVRAGDVWRPLAPITRERVAPDGAALFLPSRAELGQLFAAFGRPKDLARARLLAGLS